MSERCWRFKGWRPPPRAVAEGVWSPQEPLRSTDRQQERKVGKIISKQEIRTKEEWSACENIHLMLAETMERSTSET